MIVYVIVRRLCLRICISITVPTAKTTLLKLARLSVRIQDLLGLLAQANFPIQLII